MRFDDAVLVAIVRAGVGALGVAAAAHHRGAVPLGRRVPRKVFVVCAGRRRAVLGRVAAAADAVVVGGLVDAVLIVLSGVGALDVHPRAALR